MYSSRDSKMASLLPFVSGRNESTARALGRSRPARKNQRAMIVSPPRRAASSSRVGDRSGDRMTRIGFAYNQKPESIVPSVTDDGEEPRPEEEPPSTRRDALSRSPASPAAAGAAAASPPLSASAAAIAAAGDEFAGWDSPATIDAVAHAL